MVRATNNSTRGHGQVKEAFPRVRRTFRTMRPRKQWRNGETTYNLTGLGLQCVAPDKPVGADGMRR